MKSKIAIFQTDLGLGGIQKSLINLLNNVDVSKYDIDLYLFSYDNFYKANFPKGINVIHKKSPSWFYRFVPFGIFYLLTRVGVSKKYDVAIDFNGYQNITATYALKTPAKQHIYWVHSDLYIRRKVRQRNIFKSMYMRLLLTPHKWARFDKFVGVSEGVLEGFRVNFPRKDFTVISNFIDEKDIIKKSNEKIDDLDIDKRMVNLVTVGRLEYAKGIDLLMPKIVEVIKKRQDIHLYVIGDGSQRAFLENQVEQLGLKDHVTFLGAKKNPYKYLAKMDGLILYSRYEGQGMVLMEAQVLGLPYYFPKRLEKYNVDLRGVDNITSTLVDARKLLMRKSTSLRRYNQDIVKNINLLFTGQ